VSIAISSTGRSRPNGRLHCWCSPRDDDLGLSRHDRHRGLADHTAAGAAAEADLAEPRDVAEPDVAGDVDLAVVLHRVGRETVDVAGCDPALVQRARDREARELQLRLGQSLAERRLTDPDDRGPVGERAAHDFLGVALHASRVENDARDRPTTP
jgi:hypothetical protein